MDMAVGMIVGSAFTAIVTALSNGILKWSRPFNNRANRSTRKGVHSRVSNEERRRFYETFKRRAA